MPKRQLWLIYNVILVKILFSADFHGEFTRLFQLSSKFDLCICCGDIFEYHHPPSNNFSFPIPFYSIKGNKEIWGGKNLEDTLKNCKNFFWLNKHLDQLEDTTGLRFLGLDFGQILETIPRGIDALICHQPAYGLADQCSDPFHAKMVPHCGDKSIRKLVDIYQPNFLIAGHVHHFQKQQYQKTLAITLPTALNDPVISLNDKKIVQSAFKNFEDDLD